MADALMKRVAMGDESAFAAVFDELSPLVYGVVLRVVRSPDISREVVQDVFVELWKSAPRFDASKGSARALVTTIAHRRAVDRVRSEESRRRREDADHQRSTPNETDVVVEAATAREETSEVRAALATLTATQREAVVLAYYHGRTYREVAVLLKIPEGTAKTRIRDGLIRLRDQIGHR